MKNKEWEEGSNNNKMKRTKQTGNGYISNVTSKKKILPIAYNIILLFPENIINSNNLNEIEDKCILVTINDDNSIKIKSYKNIFVEQLWNCTYDDKNQVFTFNYKYKLPSGNEWITVSETLTRVN